MPDQFNALTSCDEHLPSASIVDAVAFHRFLSLRLKAQDGSSHPAVYPPDRAVPELVREAALEGWPPRNITDIRGGMVLVSDWEAPAEEPKTKPLVRVQADDLDQFLADPRATVDGEETRLPLDAMHVRALLETGRMLLRLPDAQPVLVTTSAPAVSGQHAITGQIVIPGIEAVVGGNITIAGGERLQLTRENLRELREHGMTRVPAKGDISVVIDRGSLADTGAAQFTSLAESPAARTQVARAGRVDGRANVGERLVRGSVEPGLRLQPDDSPIPIPDFPFVVYVSYRQEWKLAGFARGDLVTTIALAPQEETTIEVFTWDRNRWARDATEEVGWESTLEAQATGRITRDVTRELTRNEAWKLTSAGVEVGVPQVVDVGANLGGEFGDTLNDVNQWTVSRISEATSKAAAKARGLRQTKVTEAREWGFEERTTRKLRNQNSCRSVAFDIFEVLAAYDVTTRVVRDETRLAVLVPSPLPVRFDRATLLAWEGVLRSSLVDQVHAGGFDAARSLAARDEYCAMCSEPPCCPPAATQPPAGPPVSTAAPTNPASTPPDATAVARDRVLAAGDRVSAAVTDLRTATHLVASAWDAGVRGAALEEVILQYRQWMCRVFGLEKFQPGFWGACLRFESEWPSNRSPERVEQLLNETGMAWLEAVGRAAIAILLFQLAAPILAIEIVAHLGVKTLWYSQYTARGFDDAGLGALLTAARTEAEAWRKSLATASVPPNGDGGASESPPQPSPPAAPPSPPEGAPAAEPFPREQVAAHRVAERALLAHLEQNRTHYLEALWRSMTPSDRARILSGSFGALADDVDPEALGFFGDRIAVPFRTTRYPQLRNALAEAIATLEVEPVPDAKRVVLPTTGIHIQARIDDCDACEPFVERLRELEIAEKEAAVARAVALSEQAQLERDRLRARLGADMLDSPSSDCARISIRVEPDIDSPPDA